MLSPYYTETMIETKKVPKNLFDLAKPSVVGRARAGLLNYRALSSDKRSPLSLRQTAICHSQRASETSWALTESPYALPK